MSSTFTVSRDQIIKQALIKLNVLEIGDTPDAETIAHCSLALNLWIKEAATHGLKIWKNEELVMTKDTQPVNLVANDWHEIEALEDGTVFANMFAEGKY